MDFVMAGVSFARDIAVGVTFSPFPQVHETVSSMPAVLGSLALKPILNDCQYCYRSSYKTAVSNFGFVNLGKSAERNCRLRYPCKLTPTMDKVHFEPWIM